MIKRIRFPTEAPTIEYTYVYLLVTKMMAIRMKVSISLYGKFNLIMRLLSL
jgi:hypothetical protein